MKNQPFELPVSKSSDAIDPKNNTLNLIDIVGAGPAKWADTNDRSRLDSSQLLIEVLAKKTGDKDVPKVQNAGDKPIRTWADKLALDSGELYELRPGIDYKPQDILPPYYKPRPMPWMFNGDPAPQDDLDVLNAIERHRKPILDSIRRNRDESDKNQIDPDKFKNMAEMRKWVRENIPFRREDGFDAIDEFIMRCARASARRKGLKSSH